MSNFAKVAAQVANNVYKHRVAEGHDAEWQRVYSLISDLYKENALTYSKLTRLQSNFVGPELSQLEKIAEAVLMTGDQLSVFARDFYEGKYEMEPSEVVYGDAGGAPMPNPEVHEPAPAAPSEPLVPMMPPPASAEADTAEEPDKASQDNFDIPVEMVDEEEPEEDESKEEDTE